MKLELLRHAVALPLAFVVGYALGHTFGLVVLPLAAVVGWLIGDAVHRLGR